VRWVRALDMQVTLHDKRIVMQVVIAAKPTVAANKGNKGKAVMALAR
nr:hypothetical protein [Tanacetum cinerariifolium]